MTDVCGPALSFSQLPAIINILLLNLAVPLFLGCHCKAHTLNRSVVPLVAGHILAGPPQVIDKQASVDATHRDSVAILVETDSSQGLGRVDRLQGPGVKAVGTSFGGCRRMRDWSSGRLPLTGLAGRRKSIGKLVGFFRGPRRCR